MYCERGSEMEIEIKGFPIYLTYEFLGEIFKKGNSHLRNPCEVNSLTASGFLGHFTKIQILWLKIGSRLSLLAVYVIQ